MSEPTKTAARRRVVETVTDSGSALGILADASDGGSRAAGVPRTAEGIASARAQAALNRDPGTPLARAVEKSAMAQAARRSAVLSGVRAGGTIAELANMGQAVADMRRNGGNPVNAGDFAAAGSLAGVASGAIGGAVTAPVATAGGAGWQLGRLVQRNLPEAWNDRIGRVANQYAQVFGGGVYDEGTSDTIGRQVNQVVRGAGRLVGQDWGVTPAEPKKGIPRRVSSTSLKR